MVRAGLAALLATAVLSSAHGFAGLEQHLQNALCQLHNDATAHHTEEEIVEKVCSFAPFLYEQCHEKARALWEAAEFTCSDASAGFDPKTVIDRLTCRLLNHTTCRHKLEATVCDLAVNKVHINITSEECSIMFEMAWARAEENCPEESRKRDELTKSLPEINKRVCDAINRANVTSKEAADEICTWVVKERPRVCPMACKAVVGKLWLKLEEKCAPAPAPAPLMLGEPETPASVVEAICRALNNSAVETIIINRICTKVAANSPAVKARCTLVARTVWTQAAKRCTPGGGDVDPEAGAGEAMPEDVCNTLNNVQHEDFVTDLVCRDLKISPMPVCRMKLEDWWKAEKAKCPVPGHMPPFVPLLKKLFCHEVNSTEREDAVQIACKMVHSKDPTIPEDCCKKGAGEAYDRAAMTCAGEKPPPILPELKKLACDHFRNASLEVDAAREVCRSFHNHTELPEGLCEAVFDVTWAHAEEKCMTGHGTQSLFV
eukprot:NODE_5049_length_1815_cov_6.367891.p1 GENE.NODE_5049_length_1815_cov_6.367891~~NODE_5049_length_1815_cov_6.367891.p1  ORF type:complete len:489 (+),score=121.49 NODE_5049_length_1815_cov_6.367891:98-1564(+)